MIAGLGLSGDLKDPRKSIPLGTIGATLAGMVVYVLVAVKLAESATPEALAADNFIMEKIALWGPIIFIGLGAAALSSTLGSIMVAPRTLQMLARDNVLPIPKLNRLMEKGVGDSHEPIYATCLSGIIAIVFVAIGELDFIAQILTMFFMVTYGALCAVSLLEHFASNPSYRPTFHSRWYVSLVGAVMCGVLMMQIGPFYALLSIVLMAITYLGLRRGHAGPTRPCRHLPRDNVPTHAMATDNLAKKSGHGIRRWLAAFYRCSNTVRRTPSRSFRSAPLDLPQARVRSLHPTL